MGEHLLGMEKVGGSSPPCSTLFNSKKVMRKFVFLFLAHFLVFAQSYIKENYNKKVVQIPMRDGVKLTTIIYIPKDTTKLYPILLYRTPYRIGNYKPGQFHSRLGPTEIFVKSGFIYVLHNVRG